MANVETCLARVEAGESLSVEDVTALVAAPDLLPLGMLADALRRRIHGSRVTYVRVADGAGSAGSDVEVPEAAGEVRIAATPATLDAALSVVRLAAANAGGRPVSGFAWPELLTAIRTSGADVKTALSDLRQAGLDGLVELPLDGATPASDAIGALREAGFVRLRLTMRDAAPADRLRHLLSVAELHTRFGGIQAVAPLPTVLHAARPTTGYDDVKAVACARLVAPLVPSIQVDWLRYGPKLAQVALTFGADDLDAVSASDESADGRRRAPLEEVRRNIEAAGFVAVERNGRYEVRG